MIPAEAAYFEGHHVQHIADYHERQRLERLAPKGFRKCTLSTDTARHRAPATTTIPDGPTFRSAGLFVVR